MHFTAAPPAACRIRANLHQAISSTYKGYNFVDATCMQHTIAVCSANHRIPPGRRCRLSASRFHIVLGELDALLTAEQRQQDEHALVRPHSGIEAQLPRKWTLQDPHLITRL